MSKYPLQWLDDKVVHFSRSDLRNFLVNIPKYPKRVILMVADFILLFFAVWSSFSLRFNELYWPQNLEFGLVLLAAPFIGIMTFFFLGVYKTVTRFIGFMDVIRIYFSVFIAVLVWLFFIYSLNIYTTFPSSVALSYGALSILWVWLARWLAAALLRGKEHLTSDLYTHKKKILIYGAGITGTQLVEKLLQQNSFEIIAFVDDNPSLWKRRIMGYKIHSPDHIQSLIEEKNIKEVILALPSASIGERKRILRFIEPYPISVQTLPAVEDIVSGRVSIGDLKVVGVEDLLGRDPVPPDIRLFDKVILGKSVLVTGAGGSIGSELSRQIFRARPEKIILFDISEVSLYLVEQEMLSCQEILTREDDDANTLYQKIEIIPVIGSVLDASRILTVMTSHKIQTIFHAAAYKHVPLVEINPVTGLRNNFCGTRIVADMALKAGVERFVLISTDKAVRPTNVMGASKRLAEMYLQALSQKHKGDNPKTIFTMVRFGNVLDSSGSVVQKFRKQITEGGPVTVTDPNITRFFMSIPEAAELVIQAGAMANGGEVYVLDMGEPVKILDLASTMIRLMGLEVRNEGNPDGDIEVLFSGLRYGEKLYEELLIEETSKPTRHPRIKKNNEPFLEMKEFQPHLLAIEKIIEQDDVKKLYQILEILVTGYVPSAQVKKSGQCDLKHGVESV